MAILRGFAFAWVVQVVCIVLFLHGFFLTRLELPLESECSDPPALRPNVQGMAPVTCWFRPRYDRVIIIVIDALRLDFAEWSKEAESLSRLPHFRNKIPTVRRLLRENRGNISTSRATGSAHLFHFYSDAPTVTMQRIKGLATGGLPTFFEFRRNFASDAVDEDNIMAQVRDNGLGLAFSGDDTWLRLFPRMFSRANAFPSFDVWDLDTVDAGCRAHVHEDMKSSDCKLIVSHFLGLDHAGHRFHADSSAVESKLREADVLVDKVTRNARSRDLVLVLGDHGMTPDGNHGGATHAETGAALFAYSPKASSCDWVLGRGEDEIWEHDNLDALGVHGDTRRVDQLDFAATVAASLGVPVPFGSLGRLVPELLLDSRKEYWDLDSRDDPDIDACVMALAELVVDLRTNAMQVARYIRAYDQVAPTPALGPQSQVDSTLRRANLAFEQVFNGSGFGDGQRVIAVEDVKTLRGAAREFYKYIGLVQQLARKHWTTFSLPHMISAVFLIVVLLGGLLWNQTVTAGAVSMGAKQTLGVSVAGIEAHAMPASTLVRRIRSVDTDAALKTQSRLKYATLFRQGYRVENVSQVMAVALFLACTTGVFSTQRLPHEDVATAWAIRAICIWIWAAKWRKHSVSVSMFGLSFLTGVGTWFVFTLPSIPANARPRHIDMNYSAITWTLATTAAAAALPWLNQSIRRDNARQKRWEHWILFRIHPIICGLVATSWIFGSDKQFGSLADLLSIWLPRVVFLATAAVLCAILRAQTATGHPLGRLFGQFLCCLAAWGWTLAMLCGPGFPYLSVIATVGLRGISHAATLRLSSWEFVVFGWLSERAAFFATGHANRISSLQTEAAFVGFRQFQVVRSGIALFLNTLGPSCLMAFAMGTMRAKQRPSDVRHWVRRSAVLDTVSLGCSLINALIQRRHLEVWALFAPKLLFECAIVTATGATRMLVLVFVLRLGLLGHGWTAKDRRKGQ